MWPEPVERVARELRGAAIDAAIHEFPDGTPTAAAAARAIGCRLEQIVKSIVVVVDGEFVLVLVPGHRRADLESVAAALEGEEIRVARADEVLAATGFEPGAVAPFPSGAIRTVLLERTILQHSRVWIGAGTPSHMAELSPHELQRLSGAATADVAGPR
ncbi:MAG TPA: YbaK/EbsC family protein [Gaiellaceae bacterium]|jgi:prolyl-tRNA editing enzyme YbaK/EbsC (Cys-tRNA(Pro) deacylase)